MRCPAVVREPKEVERLRSTLPALPPVRFREPAELYKTGLLRVQLQPERCQPLPHRLHEPLRIPAVLEPQDEVIGIAHDVRLAPDLPRSPLAREPVVEYMVQVHVRQQRRYHRPLRRPPHEVDLQSRVHGAGVQPLPNQAQHPPVPDPHLQERHQLLPVDALEVLADVHLHDPADLAPVHRVGQRVQCVVRRTPRPEPVAEAVELRLVDRIQDLLHHRSLDDLVLQRRDTERPYAPVRLGYLDPPHGFRPVRSPLHAAVQVEQPLVQPVPVLAPPHSVHARGRVSLQREVRLPQRLRRDVVQERGELLPRLPLPELPYPLRSG